MPTKATMNRLSCLLLFPLFVGGCMDRVPTVLEEFKRIADNIERTRFDQAEMRATLAVQEKVEAALKDEDRLKDVKIAFYRTDVEVHRTMPDRREVVYTHRSLNCDMIIQGTAEDASKQIEEIIHGIFRQAGLRYDSIWIRSMLGLFAIEIHDVRPGPETWVGSS